MTNLHHILPFLALKEGMQLPSLTLILSLVFLIYIAHSIWNLAKLFIAPSCSTDDHCIDYILRHKPKLQMLLFTCPRASPRSISDSQLAAAFTDFDVNTPFQKSVQLKLPRETVQNGSLWLHAFVVRGKRKGPVSNWDWNDASQADDRVYSRMQLSMYRHPSTATYQLLSGGEGSASGSGTKGGVTRPVTHLKSSIGLNILTGVNEFPQVGIPAELQHHLRLSSEGHFLPIIQFDILNDRLRNLEEIGNNSTFEMTFNYSPVSIGLLRLMLHVSVAFETLRNVGFGDKDLDEVKGIFADTNMYLLCATVFVSSMHLLFDFLALKNDVSFWRSRRSLAGLSRRAIVWRAFSQLVVLAYLIDERTTLLVLGPAGVSALIEMWKVKKVWSGGGETGAERLTRQYDAESMRHLSYVLYPLCAAAAGYSLLYESHTSWYSWCVHSLVNAVYAFGFLFMLPQLFINYRLKSVAHLPWRAFMYKAFNTFIDDVFAFIIPMPTAHRLACFRDDFVFAIYLYQRWLYPVDKTRLDEAATETESDTDKKEL